MTSITTIIITIFDLLQFSLLRPNRLFKHADLRFNLYQLCLEPSAITMLPFLLFSKHKDFKILEIDKKILLLLGQLDLDQILDFLCFSFLYACNVLDCKIQREIRRNPSFDITLDFCSFWSSFFYHDKISSSFEEFHGNITVSWKLSTVTYCCNERYYQVRNLTDQVDKKDETYTKLIKTKSKKLKQTKNWTWWSRRLFCSACVRTRAVLNSLQAKKHLWLKTSQELRMLSRSLLVSTSVY